MQVIFKNDAITVRFHFIYKFTVFACVCTEGVLLYVDVMSMSSDLRVILKCNHKVLTEGLK